MRFVRAKSKPLLLSLKHLRPGLFYFTIGYIYTCRRMRGKNENNKNNNHYLNVLPLSQTNKTNKKSVLNQYTGWPN